MSNIQRIYNMNDAELTNIAANLVSNMLRDESEFNLRGISHDMIMDFRTLSEAFEVLPNDNYYYQDYILATQSKNSTRETCTVKLRNIIGYAKIFYGANSAQAKKFGAGKMTLQPDKTFLSTCRMGVQTASEYLPDLISVGLTQLMIDSLAAAVDVFEANLNEIASAQTQRVLLTNGRLNQGNELYSYVSRYSSIGKIIWYGVDAAKFNDYLIYRQARRKKGKKKIQASAVDDNSSE